MDLAVALGEDGAEKQQWSGDSKAFSQWCVDEELRLCLYKPTWNKVLPFQQKLHNNNVLFTTELCSQNLLF